ncbi:tetratricopeptide repeat protein [Marinomonas shanghaiensis]|uniref:tetratricopeptide repeat protein n=1 Tax=Marinomonas shanghaiensis TaxID=2202418 RepID=UPI003A8DBBF5
MRVVLYILLIFSPLISGIWWFVERGYEPIVTTITCLIALIAYAKSEYSNKKDEEKKKRLKGFLIGDSNLVLAEVENHVLEKAIEDIINDKRSTEVVEAIEAGDIHKAIILLKKDVDISQNVLLGKWRKIGMLAFFTDTNESINAFKKIISLDESNLEAHLVYSDLLIRIGKYQEVIDLLSAKNTKVEPKIKAMLKRTLGVAYKYLGELDLSEKMYNDGLIIAKSINNIAIEAEILNDLGLIFKIKDDLSKAKENYKKSMLLMSDSNKNLSVVYGNLAVIYKKENNLSEAKKYYEKALEIDLKNSNRYGCARHKGNLGNVYIDQGNFLLAEKYYKESLNLYKELDAKKDIAICSINIGRLHLMKGEFDDALGCFNSALSINEEINHKEGIGLAKYNIGVVEFELDNVNEALENLESSLFIYEGLGAEKTVLKLKSAISEIKCNR